MKQIQLDSYKSTYFIENENYDMWLERVAKAYSTSSPMASRITSYIRKNWFHPSTPPSANGGTDRGLPVSCYVSTVGDSKKDIFDSYNESFWLGSEGGGKGTEWSKVREINAPVGNKGKSSGIIPFIKVSDTASLAVSQGVIRRFSEAIWLDVSHPEIEEFINIRNPIGDINRVCTNTHIGVTLSDEFMEKVEKNETFDLISPKNQKVISSVKARELFIEILEQREIHGEPMLMFKDNVNREKPVEYVKLDLDITTSNLCSEILIHTSPERTGVCVLSSINLEQWDEYKNNDEFWRDILEYTDNINTEFIYQSKDKIAFNKARLVAEEERNLGIGVMGFHNYLLKNKIPFESLTAKMVNKKIFSHMKRELEKAEKLLTNTKGSCELNIKAREKNESIPRRRNIMITAIAPTTSISILSGNTSSGIEPLPANCYSEKTKLGTYFQKNKYLEEDLEKLNMNTKEVWDTIMKNDGSVQHLDIDVSLKELYKTAYEIDQRYVVELASDRQKYIDQGQSINLFFSNANTVRQMYDVHMLAWKKGIKTLYYCRTKSIFRANNKTIEERECLYCQ